MSSPHADALLLALCRHRSGDREEEDCCTSFTFSRVFGPDASQQEFYNATAAPMVRGLMDSGLSSVMMAYGVSGAGKTYTMEVRRPSASIKQGDS